MVKLIILFDGGCPLCKKEIDFLRSRNQEGNLNFIDINSSYSTLETEYGITYKDAMERIHAIKNNGSIIKDVKVFQEAYNLIRMGWVYAPTKLPITNRIFELIYKFWAKYRLQITFRPYLKKLCNSIGLECP